MPSNAAPPENLDGIPEPAAEPLSESQPERSEPIAGQNERAAIRGIVTDAETGRGMPGANLER